MSRKNRNPFTALLAVCIPILCIILCIVGITHFAPSLLDTLFPPIGTENGGETTAGETITLPEWADDTPPDGSLERYYFYQLNDAERLIYVALLDGLQTPTDTVVLRNTDYYAVTEALPRVTKAFAYDHPEFFWLSSSYSAQGEIYPNENDDVVTVKFATCDFWSLATSATQAEALRTAVKRIADEARLLDGDYEQIKFVHDYISKHTVYDRVNGTVRNLELNSAYSCLIEGRAVCGGYANAFHLVLEELGIPATVIAGRANNEAHMWSCVTVSGHNYLMDVTWDDTDKEGDVTYLYFGLTSEELLKTHSPEAEFDPPLCTSHAYNYYRHEKLYLETYSFEALSAIVSAQSDKTAATVKLSNAEELKKATDDLFLSEKWASLPGFSDAKTIRYSVDDEHFILILNFP